MQHMVTTGAGTTPRPSKGAVERQPSAHYPAIAFWLIGVALMVLVMVVIGGLTRLTESGLSIVEWRPFTGWIPPLSSADWQALFDEYRQFPEYQKVNFGMTLAEFQNIFWLEYIHRLWGRLIGLAFALPFIFFIATGRVDRRLAWRLAGLFVLGGLQGLLGWVMVKSGLVDRPDVSAYRLTAHLVLALAIYAALLWTGWSLLLADRRPARSAGGALTILPLAVIIPTLVFGGFVAGTNAGFAFNTFPTMDGEWVPADLLRLEPWWLNFFENIAAIQFAHRWLGITTLIVVVFVWWRLAGGVLDRRGLVARHLLLAAAVTQVALGLSTLLLVVPTSLAAMHQAGGVILLTAALWLRFVTRASAAPPPARH